MQAQILIEWKGVSQGLSAIFFIRPPCMQYEQNNEMRRAYGHHKCLYALFEDDNLKIFQLVFLFLRNKRNGVFNKIRRIHTSTTFTGDF